MSRMENVAPASGGMARGETGEITEITLERTPCFGTCPVYKVTLRRDGTAFYEGNEYVRQMGKHRGTIEAPLFDRLAQRVAGKGFFDLEGHYSEPVTDHPSVITTVLRGGTRKRVDRYANAGPRALKTLERAIDAAANRIGWEKTGG
jgi:hypothetical protein